MDAALAHEKHALDFMRGRDRSPIGAGIVKQWARTLPKGAEVLEIACGSGYPITKELVDADLQLWAIDSSKTLIAEFQSRFPDIPARFERAQESSFFDRKFAAAIAVGLIFLLSKPDQIALIKRVSKSLMPGGRFLFTAPIEKGAWRDKNTGIDCMSLGYKKYKEILETSDLRIISTFEDKGRNNYYEAEKNSSRCCESSA